VVAAFDTAETLTALCGSSTAPIGVVTDDIREAVHCPVTVVPPSAR
jgi:hypothetical protein